MGALLLEPHNDDAALFACFTALREQAHVVTVLRSVRQTAFGITAEQRELEQGNAMALLGLGWQQWALPDVDPPWGEVERRVRDIHSDAAYDLVYAPAVEDGGHDHHNQLGELAGEVFGDQARHYLTYTKAGKSTGGTLVEPEPEWVTLKLRALACYRSQIETPAAGCQPHFLRDQNEYLT